MTAAEAEKKEAEKKEPSLTEPSVPEPPPTAVPASTKRCLVDGLSHQSPKKCRASLPNKDGAAEADREELVHYDLDVTSLVAKIVSGNCALLSSIETRLICMPQPLLENMYRHLVNFTAFGQWKTLAPLKVDTADKGWRLPWDKTTSSTALGPSSAQHLIVAVNMASVKIVPEATDLDAKTSTAANTTISWPALCGMYRQYFEEPAAPPWPIPVNLNPDELAKVCEGDLPPDGCFEQDIPYEMLLGTLLGIFMNPHDDWQKFVQSLVVHMFANGD